MLLITAACFENAPAVAVSPEEGRKIVASTPDLFLIDVRKPELFAQKHYPDAVNIPVSELGSQIYTIPANRPILMYCRSGNSVKTAYAILKKLRPELLKSVRYIRLCFSLPVRLNKARRSLRTAPLPFAARPEHGFARPIVQFYLYEIPDLSHIVPLFDLTFQ